MERLYKHFEIDCPQKGPLSEGKLENMMKRSGVQKMYTKCGSLSCWRNKGELEVLYRRSSVRRKKYSNTLKCIFRCSFKA